MNIYQKNDSHTIEKVSIDYQLVASSTNNFFWLLNSPHKFEQYCFIYQWHLVAQQMLLLIENKRRLKKTTRYYQLLPILTSFFTIVFGMVIQCICLAISRPIFPFYPYQLFRQQVGILLVLSAEILQFYGQYNIFFGNLIYFNA